jgi:hypothetical protein
VGNLDLEEQIAQVRTELARIVADEERLTGELGCAKGRRRKLLVAIGATPPRIPRHRYRCPSNS